MVADVPWTSSPLGVGVAVLLAFVDSDSAWRLFEEVVREAGLMSTCIALRCASGVGRRPRVVVRSGSVGATVGTSVTVGTT